MQYLFINDPDTYVKTKNVIKYAYPRKTKISFSNANVISRTTHLPYSQYGRVCPGVSLIDLLAFPGDATVSMYKVT